MNNAYISLSKSNNYSIHPSEIKPMEMPVIDGNGMQIGKVHDMIINKENGEVAYIQIELDSSTPLYQSKVGSPTSTASTSTQSRTVYIPVSEIRMDEHHRVFRLYENTIDESLRNKETGHTRHTATPYTPKIVSNEDEDGEVGITIDTIHESIFEKGYAQTMLRNKPSLTPNHYMSNKL